MMMMMLLAAAAAAAAPILVLIRIRYLHCSIPSMKGAKSEGVKEGKPTGQTTTNRSRSKRKSVKIH